MRGGGEEEKRIQKKDETTKAKVTEKREKWNWKRGRKIRITKNKKFNISIIFLRTWSYTSTPPYFS
jgi:hypothetical protein